MSCKIDYKAKSTIADQVKTSLQLHRNDNLDSQCEHGDSQQNYSEPHDLP